MLLHRLQHVDPLNHKIHRNGYIAIQTAVLCLIHQQNVQVALTLLHCEGVDVWLIMAVRVGVGEDHDLHHLLHLTRRQGATKLMPIVIPTLLTN